MSNKQESTPISATFQFIYFSEIFSLKHGFPFQNLIDNWFPIIFFKERLFIRVFALIEPFIWCLALKWIKIRDNYKYRKILWKVWNHLNHDDGKLFDRVDRALLRRGWDSSAITGSRSASKPSSFHPARKITLHKSDLRETKIWERNDHPKKDTVESAG